MANSLLQDDFASRKNRLMKRFSAAKFKNRTQFKSSGLIGSMKGKISIKGNILSTGLKWGAESREKDKTPPRNQKV